MILAVDASSVTAAAALCSGDGAVVRSDFLHNGLTHSETLLPMIRRVLGDTSVADRHHCRYGRSRFLYRGADRRGHR